MVADNLWDLTPHINHEWSGDNMVIEDQRLTALVTTAVVPVSQTIGDGSAKYFFCVQNFLTIDPKPCIVSDDYSSRRWFATSYKLAVQPTALPEKGLISLLPDHLQPTSTQSGKTMTTGTDISIGGNVGFFGADPTAGVSASYGVHNSESHSLPDVTVTMDVTEAVFVNDSSEEPLRAEWLFEFSQPTFSDSGLFGHAGYSQVCTPARSAFEMSTAQIYQVDHAYFKGGATGLSLQVELTVLLANAWAVNTPGNVQELVPLWQAVDLVTPTSNIDHHEMKESYTVDIPIPPLPRYATFSPTGQAVTETSDGTAAPNAAPSGGRV